MLIRMKATLIPRSAFDRYEARVRRARELYRAAGEKSADLPNFQRMAADDVAFTALKSVQQDAMREFIASESQGYSICGTIFRLQGQI